MTTQQLIRSLIFFLPLMFIPQLSGAVTGLTVEICGEALTIPPGATEVILSNADGSAKDYDDCNITIAGLSGNVAKVRTSDAANDQLWVENAIITATEDSVTADIKFWATFDDPPSGQVSPVTFRRSQAATLRRGNYAATHDWFKITGWADNNEIYQAEIKTIYCPFSACANINLATREEDWQPPSMLGPREIKGQFMVHFKFANDKLNITQVKVDNPAGG